MSSNKNIKYKCPYCDKREIKTKLINHINDYHEDMIPEGYSAMQLVFNIVNRKPLDYQGSCVICKAKTRFDENKGRYDRLCGKPACKEEFLRRFEENMIKATGTTRISSTAEGQAKMLANRKISGKYKFQNGVEKTYTGKYELNTLKFMDQVMNINPDDIMCPGPVLEYMYNGEKHLYITDFYYIPYDLIIEVKDGGNNPNKRNMPEYRAKQIAKEEFIIKNTNYNYLRLTDNDLSQLLAVFMDLKIQLVDSTNDRVVQVNEAMNALMTGYIPGLESDGSVYIVNYMQNNVFAQGLTDSPKLDNLIIRDNDGLLKKADIDFLSGKSYKLYKTDKSIEEVSKLFAPYMNTEVNEHFIYETFFNKKYYTDDQLALEESIVEIIPYQESLDLLSEVTKNYIMGKDNMTKYFMSESLMINLKDDKFYMESKLIPELYLELSDKSKWFLNGLSVTKENI